MPPRILSIAICTYKRAGLLSQALPTVLEQDAPLETHEVIVVDNANDPATYELVESWQNSHPNLRYVNETQTGISNARNRGWQEAQGKYVGYLDDDCKAPAGWVRSALEIAKLGYEAFGGPYHAFYNTPKPAWFRDAYGSHVQGERARALEVGERLDGGNMFIRRDILAQLGGFQADLGMKGGQIAYGEETDLFNRLRTQMPKAVLYYAPAVFVYHLVRPEKFNLWNLPRWRFSSGMYAGKIRQDKVRMRAPRAVYHLLGTCIKLAKSLLLDLPLRDRKHYPFFQNYLFEKTMTYFGELGMQVQFLEESLGLKD